LWATGRRAGPSGARHAQGGSPDCARLPPAHQTPNLKDNEWVYYDTPGFVERVVFADDKIQSINRGPAPE